jgi:multidrug resistance efflux pump
MVREVRGPGTLVPEQSRYITAVTQGRVEQRMVLPGAEVDDTTTIITMSNPDVEVQLLQAQQQLSNAQASLVSMRTNLENQRLNQASVVAQTRTQFREARRQYQINKQLYDTNPELVIQTELERTRDEVEALEERLSIEEQRLDVLTRSIDEQIATQESQVRRLRDIVEFNQDRVASMVVKAGVPGVLAELPVQEGVWVNAGGTIARIVQPGRLKAEINIPQTQAQDIVVGQKALIDTRNDTIEGRVARIDPAVQGGTVLVDVRLPDELPRSARPDQSVDGTIEIERLENVVHVGRPAYGQANQRVGIFKLDETGEHAVRVTALLGRSSVNEIEVREGLQPGDVVILSDMSQWDGFDRVRIDR